MDKYITIKILTPIFFNFTNEIAIRLAILIPTWY